MLQIKGTKLCHGDNVPRHFDRAMNQRIANASRTMPARLIDLRFQFRMAGHAL